MTKQELNRDIKRLLKKVKDTEMDTMDNFYHIHEPAIKTEFKRLFYADDNFHNMNKTSILIMIRLNQRFRVIPFHHFGNKIEI